MCDCVKNHTINENQTCDTVTGACLCTAFWEGDTCNDDVIECKNNDTCQNVQNAGCHNSVGGFECGCKRGFEKNDDNICEKGQYRLLLYFIR